MEEVGCDPTEHSARSLLAGALKGGVEILEYLLQLGCDVNGQAYYYKWEWKPAVCSAAESGQADAVRLLIEHGADLDPVLRDGTAMCYPLRLALRHHRRKIAELLLKHMDITTLSADPERQGVLLRAAAACGLEELAGRLVEHGCKPEAELPDNGNLITYSRFGCTASPWAAGSGHTNVLELLLNHGTDSR